MGTFVCGVLCRIIAILITYGIDAITSPIDPSSYAPTPTNNPIATSNSTTVNLSSTYIPSQSNPTTKPTVYHSLDAYYCFSTYSDRYSSFNASLCGRNIELERELFYNNTITQGINFKNYYTIPTEVSKHDSPLACEGLINVYKYAAPTPILKHVISFLISKRGNNNVFNGSKKGSCMALFIPASGDIFALLYYLKPLQYDGIKGGIPPQNQPISGDVFKDRNDAIAAAVVEDVSIFGT